MNIIPSGIPQPSQACPADGGGVPTQYRALRRRRSFLTQGASREGVNCRQGALRSLGLCQTGLQSGESDYLNCVSVAHAEMVNSGAFVDVQQVVGEFRFE